uniref:Very-long-chain 3-oxoacyl-CoA synthase n=1 Tax=Steinernema glaseri TaxID=37863 RepID=A0A1I7ZG70_9BILA
MENSCDTTDKCEEPQLTNAPRTPLEAELDLYFFNIQKRVHWYIHGVLLAYINGAVVKYGFNPINAKAAWISMLVYMMTYLAYWFLIIELVIFGNFWGGAPISKFVYNLIGMPFRSAETPEQRDRRSWIAAVRERLSL